MIYTNILKVHLKYNSICCCLECRLTSINQILPMYFYFHLAAIIIPHNQCYCFISQLNNCFANLCFTQVCLLTQNGPHNLYSIVFWKKICSIQAAYQTGYEKKICKVVFILGYQPENIHIFNDVVHTGSPQSSYLALTAILQPSSFLSLRSRTH